MKKIAMLLAGVVLVYLGVKLTRFSEVDDAPGGVVVGWLLVASGAGVGLTGLLTLRGGPSRG